MVVQQLTNPRAIRCQQIQQTGVFSYNGLALLHRYHTASPLFTNYLYQTFLPNLNITDRILLRSDFDDVDRNLINTAFMRWNRIRRTNNNNNHLNN